MQLPRAGFVIMAIIGSLYYPAIFITFLYLWLFYAYRWRSQGAFLILHYIPWLYIRNHVLR